MLATLLVVVLVCIAILLFVIANRRRGRVAGEVRDEEPQPAAAHARERTRFAVQQGPSRREDEDWFLYEFTITPTGPGNAMRVRASLVYADSGEEVTDERVEVSDYLRAREPRRIRLRVPNDLHEHPEQIGRSIIVRIEWEDGAGPRKDTFGSPIEVGRTGIRRR
jgi:hypothetical protein